VIGCVVDNSFINSSLESQVELTDLLTKKPEQKMRNLIDVNNNTALTGSLAAEINQYRRELRQKDELIKELSTTQPITHVTQTVPVQSGVRFREQYAENYGSYPGHGHLHYPNGRNYHSHYSETMPPTQAHQTQHQTQNHPNSGIIHHHVHTNPPAEVHTSTTIHEGVKSNINATETNAEVERTRRELYDTRRLLEREFDDRKLLERSSNTRIESISNNFLSSNTKLLIDRLQTENNQKSDRIIKKETKVKHKVQ
jgi:hypothetical protein